MVMCFDIGNTDIDVGVFERDKLTDRFKINYRKSYSSQEYSRSVARDLRLRQIDPDSAERAVICSVVPTVTEKLREAVYNVLDTKPLIFQNDGYCGMDIKIPNPAEVGSDIIAACFEVKENGRLPAIVVDMGTATTLTALDEKGRMLGVSIMPGAMTALKSLAASTGLPIDESLTPPASYIGKNTKDAIASGAVLAQACAVDGMIRAFKNEMGCRRKVYSTGGVSKAIMPLCREENEYDENLLLKGLYTYYKRH